MAVKTTFSDETLRDIVAGYPVGNFVSQSGFDRGTDQTNLLIRTTKGNFAFRYYEKRSFDYVRFEIDLLNYLATREFPSPEPIADKYGDYIGDHNSKPFALFSFMPGEHQESPSNFSKVAMAVGKLHALSLGYKPAHSEARASYDVNYVWQSAQQSANKILDDAERSARLSWIENQLAAVRLPVSLPRGVCHGDMNPSNFLYAGGELVAVLDFDQSTFTYLVYDIASLIYWWAWPNTGDINLKNARALLGVYQRERPLTSDEKHHLFDMLRLVILTGTGWFMSDSEGYHNSKRKIEVLDGIGPSRFHQELFGGKSVR